MELNGLWGMSSNPHFQVVAEMNQAVVEIVELDLLAAAAAVVAEVEDWDRGLVPVAVELEMSDLAVAEVALLCSARKLCQLAEDHLAEAYPQR